MKALVTGGAGFIGSHLVEALVASGVQVRVLDNLSSGRPEHLEGVRDGIEFLEGDVAHPATLDLALKGVDEVWHLAANPEVRTGATDPAGHFQANVEATFAVLEGMRRAKVKRILFTSTSTVYGRATVIPTPESYGPLLPISVYGACKLACEALIASYAGTFGFEGILFRFANVVGERSTHGVTYDFMAKLRANPKKLHILGDGTQNKSYVSVSDTVSAMLFAARRPRRGVVLAYNIGSLDSIPVTTVADIVVQVLGIAPPRYEFGGGASDGAGWAGDVKEMRLGVESLTTLGWRPRDTSSEAIRVAAQWLARHAAYGSAHFSDTTGNL
ncbi:MAG: NAD-dependent epimerase/dehydratase family protein [Thermoplasmatota archaeon]